MKIQIFTKVIVQKSNGQVLVLKRSDDDDRRPGEWDFPGGTVEVREGPDEGAARELLEEANIVVDPKRLVLLFAATEHYEPTNDSNTRMLFYYPDQVNPKDVKVSHEHSTYKWQSIDDVLAEHPHPVYKAGLQYAVDHHLLPKQQ